MNKSEKVRIISCGVLFLIAVAGAELSPVFCHECPHVAMSHPIEKNYAAEYGQMPIDAVPAYSGTAAVNPLQLYL